MLSVRTYVLSVKECLACGLWLGVWGSAIIRQERVEPAPCCAQALPAAVGVPGLCAEVAELADAADSKSAEGQLSCRFESGLRHH